MSDSKEKLKELEAEFRKRSDDVELAVALAQQHIDAENINRAKEVLDKIIKANENSGKALLLRSQIFARRNEWLEARRDCRLARKAGAKPPWKQYYKTAYFRWLTMAEEGWRPNRLSRIATLIMSVSTGLLVTAMGVRLLLEGAYLGFVLSFVLGLGFFWGGLMVGGASLWLKDLQDRLTPGWDRPTVSLKKKQ